MAKYIVHKAIDLHKLSKQHRPTEEELKDYDWQPKVDGCNMVAIVSKDSVELLSRTGEVVQSAEHLKKELAVEYLGVYLGEYCVPNVDYAVTSGMFRHTKRQFPDANFYVFDYLTLNEWAEGEAGPWSGRWPQLRRVGGAHIVPLLPNYREEAVEWMADHPEVGYDGLIARATTGQWIKGSSGKGGEIIKVKQVLSLDLRVVNILTALGEKTGRNVYNLEVQMGDKTINVGSGVPHKAEDLPQVGDIVEIEALGYTSGGMLREPRFKGIRYDKLEPDNG